MSPLPLIDPDATFEIQIGKIIYSLSAPTSKETTRAVERTTKTRAGKDKTDNNAFSEWYRDRVIKGWRSTIEGEVLPAPTLDLKMALDLETWGQITEAVNAAGTLIAEQKEASLKN